MDIAISCLARNSQVKIDNLFGEVNFLKRIVFWIKIYSSYFLVNNRVVDRLFVASKIPRKNPSIPNDIIRLEILTRLPVKSLMRFQCVCKSWQSIICSDPVFKEYHLARTSMDPNNDWLIVRCHSKSNSGRFVNPNKDDHPLFSWDMLLAGSVNGLVCLYRYHWGSKSVPCIGIWNPATRQYKSVPPPSTASFVEFTDMSLAFCFDPIKNDYKVIYFTTGINKCGHLVAHVYSCNAASWGNIKVSSSFILEPGSHNKYIVNANGSLYWTYSTDGEDNKKYYVISFDIRHEVFRLFPSLYILPEQYMFMANLRNSLVYIVQSWANTTNVDVYVLNETMSSDRGPWSKMYTVGPITLETNMLLFHCFRNGDLLFKNSTKLKFVGIDPETHAMVDNSVHLFDASHYTHGHAHIETLAFVNGMKHINTNCEYILLIES